MISTLARRATLATASLFAVSALAAGVGPAVATGPSPDHHAALQVTKTAIGSFTRTYTWSISKSAMPSKLFVKKGHTATVHYAATLSAKATDAFGVSGNISITNPSHKRPVLVTSVIDAVSPAIAATVRCPVPLPTPVGPGQTLTCTYKAALPDATNRTNTATVATVMHNKVVNYSSAPVPIVFPNQAALVDESVAVKDFLILGDHVVAKKFLGMVSATDLVNGQKTINYWRTFGPFWKPGAVSIKNVAAFVTNDTHTKGSSSAKALVIVLPKHHHHDFDHD